MSKIAFSVVLAGLLSGQAAAENVFDDTLYRPQIEPFRPVSLAWVETNGNLIASFDFPGASNAGYELQFEVEVRGCDVAKKSDRLLQLVATPKSTRTGQTQRRAAKYDFAKGGRQTLCVKDNLMWQASDAGTVELIAKLDACCELVFDRSKLLYRPLPYAYPKPDAAWTCEYSPAVAAKPIKRGVQVRSASFTAKDVSDLAAAGATLVRFGMDDGFVKDLPKPTTREGWIELFRTMVRRGLAKFDDEILPACRVHGIEVALTMYDLPGRRDSAGEFAAFRDEGYFEEWKRAWREIATRYKGNTAGIYGYNLVNEPNNYLLADFDYWTAQKLVANEIRRIDPETPIIVECNNCSCATHFVYMKPIRLRNIIYQGHFYLPFLFTHQGVKGRADGFVYPCPERGWNKASLERDFTAMLNFRRKYGARLYMGEYSAATWSRGGDEWVRDVTELLNKHKMDWTYHSFREWFGWDSELVYDFKTKKFDRPAAAPRWQILKAGFRGASAPLAAGTLKRIVSRRMDNRTGYAFYRAAKDGAEVDGVNLFVVESNGIERRLTSGPQYDYCPSLSPDGKTVYFTSSRGGICAMPVEGGKIAVLVRGKSGEVIDPVVSPDGRTLVWSQIASFTETHLLMAAPLADLSQKRVLTEKTMSAHSPKWIDGNALEFVGYRPGDAGWCRYRIDLPSARVTNLGAADYASRPSGRVYRPQPRVRADPVRIRPAFEKIALVDSFDFHREFDLQTCAGVTQVVDHVLRTGADSLMWRQQSGGIPRYLTEEENRERTPWPVEKLRLTDNRPEVFFHSLCHNIPCDHVLEGLDAIRVRGKVAGIHYTFEEAHWSNWLLNQWTLEHPEYWCRQADGTPWMGHCSLAYPEVVEHRLRQLDELLAMEPDTLYFDGCCRCGGYYPAVMEYVPPVLDAWARQHPGKPVPTNRFDAAWADFVSQYPMDYVRAMRRRMDATGRKIRFILTADEPRIDRPAGENTRRGHGFDWVRLLKEGTIDGVAIDPIFDIEKDGKKIMERTEAVFRRAVEAAEGKPVYFSVCEYGFRRGNYHSYAKVLGITEPEAVRRLMQLAKDCGGAGIVMECVDYENYKNVEEAIRDFK